MQTLVSKLDILGMPFYMILSHCVNWLCLFFMVKNQY